jgi:mono/diheme cytochrome c family protein
MLSHRMKWTPRRLLVIPALAAAATGIAACGEQGIEVAENSPSYQGAVLFYQHCSGCHTLGAAGTEGSASNVRTSEYKDGPNFNARKEQYRQVLYAIRNGGFSSGPMPQDILTGRAAEQVARFVAKYSGRDAERPITPPTGTPEGFGNDQAPAGRTGGGEAPSGGQGTAPRP